MTFPNSAPQREVTPEESKSSARTFWLILLAFPTLVGAILAFFAFQGREVRTYGQAVLAAAQQHFDPSASYSSDCTEYLNKPVPQGVQECKVQAVNGQAEVVIKTERGQQYRVTNPK